MASFYNRLSYSLGNEDYRTEHLALQVSPEDRLLCITASGDRSLHLLLKECKEVVSVDANPSQTHLLNLKCAALKSLNYEDYLAFLGATESTERSPLYQQVIPHLSEEAQSFWHNNRTMIDKGVLYQGAIEKWCKVLARIISLLRGKRVEGLFQCETLEEQRIFNQETWNTYLWKKAFDFVLQPFFCRLFIKDPGLYAYLSPEIKAGTYIHKRLDHALNRTLAKKNLLISLVLRGKLDKAAFPPYLTRPGMELIKSRLDRLTLKTDNVLSFLEAEKDNSFDAYSLSDVSSYLSQTDFERLLRAILRTARPGARFCLRQFLSDHKFPDDLLVHFKRDTDLEKQLEEEDRCFVYRFITGTIIK